MKKLLPIVMTAFLFTGCFGVGIAEEFGGEYNPVSLVDYERVIVGDTVKGYILHRVIELDAGGVEHRYRILTPDRILKGVVYGDGLTYEYNDHTRQMVKLGKFTLVDGVRRILMIEAEYTTVSEIVVE